MSIRAQKSRFHAKSYEQAAAQFAAEINVKHWHNCSNADITMWQIGSQLFSVRAEADQEIASSPGMPTINLPVWYCVTPLVQ